MKKRIGLIVGLILFLFTCSNTKVQAEEEASKVSVTGQTTFGSFSSSSDKSSLTTETININYTPSVETSLNLSVANSKIRNKPPDGYTDQITTWLAFSQAFKLKDGGSLGGKWSLLHIRTNDSMSDKILIPAAVVFYKTDDFRGYADAGYAYTPRKDGVSINQLTFTGGVSLFNDRLWSSTRLFLIGISRNVQNRDRTFAVEQKFTYYAIPKRLALTFYGLIGERFYAYEPDTGSTYGPFDIQTGSVGLTASYDISKSLSVFGDVTKENYLKEVPRRLRHNATYSTLGVTYKF